MKIADKKPEKKANIVADTAHVQHWYYGSLCPNLRKIFHASLTSNSSLHEDTNLSTKFMAELSPQTCISGHGRPIKKTKSKTSVTR